VVGLDDSRFPSVGGQDPFLLDGERSELSEALTTSPVRRERQYERLWRTLAGLRGGVTLSYSCRDLLDDRELFPAPPLISAFRAASGNREADQCDFLDAGPLQEPVSFAPAAPEGSTDEGAWYLWRLCREGGMRDRRDEVALRFPHLARGLRAGRQRAGETFTAHDGRVPEAGEANDPRNEDGPVVSAHRLQTAGRCPRRYFFQHVLDVEAPDELEYDPDEWLDALELGSLLHEVYHDFVQRMMDEGRAPDPDRDLDAMLEVLEDRLEEEKRDNPPPRSDLEDSVRRDLRTSCYIFLARQEELYRRGRPQFLEAALGMWGGGRGSDLDTGEPITLSLPDGQGVRVRGRLDRVDRIVEGEGEGCRFAVWDYKTGSSSKYEKNGDLFKGGRLVQHALYLHMARECLRRSVRPDAEVALFGYLFAGPRSEGELIEYEPEELADGPVVLERLCRMLGSGAFLPTNESKDCRYCDYDIVCGDCEEAAEQSRRMLENTDNRVLQPFRELRTSE